MPLIKQKVEVFREEYVCDECGAGVMVFDTMQKPSGNDKFRYECSYCVVKTHLTLKYPIITYEPVASSTAQAEQPESVQTDGELKRCPFCGGQALLLSSFDVGNVWYQGQCVKCFAEAEQSGLISEAISNWNRRND